MRRRLLPQGGALHRAASRPVVLLGAALLLQACAGAPSLRYDVSLSSRRPDRLEVSLLLTGAPRRGLTLKGFATKEVLRIAEARAEDLAGHPLALDAGIETVVVNDRSLDIPRLVLRGPLPEALRISYVARPGAREGDSHMGFTGRSDGYLGGEFGLATGREIFLLPEPAEAIRRIEVRVALPDGWSLAAPWRRDGDAWRPGLDGAPAAEHLVTAALGLGRFRERSVRAGGTNFRFVFEPGITADEEDAVAARLVTAARTIHDLFGRDLGPEYLTIVAPRAPAGDDIAGEGWATGQGETLAPLTGNRLHQFALNLIDAYLRHAPYRSEIRSADEFWLVDGIANLYAWRAVAVSGLITEDEVTREMAVGYLTSIRVQGLERNVEKVYAAAGNQKIVKEVMAPMILASLDRELRARSSEAPGLDPIIRRLFHDRYASSFWSEVARTWPGGWREFRRRYVQGGTMLPVEQFYDLTPTAPKPDPPAGTAARAITVAYTGKAHGYLENCGCKVNQSGGVARRATILARLRQADPGLLLVDAGDAFVLPEKVGEIDYLTLQEQDLYLKTMDAMKYQAAAVGTAELAFGLDRFLEATRARSTPFLAANVRAGGRPIARPASIVRAGSLRVALLGVFEPPRAHSASAIYEDHAAGLAIDDPIETLRRDVPGLRKQADLVIAIGRMTPVTIRRIAAACPGLDAVISTDYDAAIRIKESGEIHPEDHSGFVGRLLVAYTPLTNYGLESVRIGLDRSGRIASADFSEHWLREDVPDDPAIRDMLNRFYDRIGRAAAAQESVPPLFADDPARLTGRYLGAEACKECHASEFAQWRRTKHGTAFKTLLDRHRHFQPKCVSCHVVGYGTPHGYRLGMTGEKLANVQCEVCHGPGAEHGASPTTANIRREVPARVCLECHTPDHSDHFVYEQRLPKVRHDYYE